MPPHDVKGCGVTQHSEHSASPVRSVYGLALEVPTLGLHCLGHQSHAAAMYLPSQIMPPVYPQSQDPQEDVAERVLVCMEAWQMVRISPSPFPILGHPMTNTLES